MLQYHVYRAIWQNSIPSLITHCVVRVGKPSHGCKRTHTQDIHSAWGTAEEAAPLYEPRDGPHPHDASCYSACGYKLLLRSGKLENATERAPRDMKWDKPGAEQFAAIYSFGKRGWRMCGCVRMWGTGCHACHPRDSRGPSIFWMCIAMWYVFHITAGTTERTISLSSSWGDKMDTHSAWLRGGSVSCPERQAWHYAWAWPERHS